jgi:hypothetical protein
MRNAIMVALAGALAAHPFDGLWATTKKDCGDTEGPDSKTFIDLDNVIKGKSAPRVDQYENHCPGRPHDAGRRWRRAVRHLL